MSEPSKTVTSAGEALRQLDDAAYFKWCRQEAEKYFMSLIRKRFPQLG